MFPVFKILAACSFTVLVFTSQVFAQAPAATRSRVSEPTPATAPSDPPDSQSGDAVRLGVTPGGMRRHVPGRWAMLTVGGSNPTDVDREETMTVVVDGETDMQYARRVWLPAGSRRSALLPIQIPEDIPYEQNLIDLSSMRIRHNASGEEEFQNDAVGVPSTRRSLLLSKQTSRAAIILDLVEASDHPGTERNEEIVEAVNRGRDLEIRDNNDEGLVHLQDHFLPASPVGLDAIDQIVIASDRILSDTLALPRLQSWLQAGGRIWIMADRVSPEAAGMLLGDEMCYSVVDRVELNQIEYATNDGSQAGTDRMIEKWSSERPVELVRVFAEADFVMCTVDDWPAAFLKRVGSGSVLFTTVAARGWISDARPLTTYAQIASSFFAGRETVPQQYAELTSFVDDEIGYAIPQRQVIAALLGLHLIVIVVAGLWLAKRESLQYLAVVIPLASVIAAAAFIAIGRQQTTAVPSTVAISQIIRNVSGNPVVNLASVAAVYSQSERQLDLSSNSDSISLFSDAPSGSQVQRLQWDDSGRSKWLFVNQPPGVVRHVETRSAVELSTPWIVRGTFAEEGFRGFVEGLPAGRREDAVIVSASTPALAVELDSGKVGRLTSHRDGIMSPGQFIDAVIVSDVQRARQELLRQILASDAAPFGREPTLLVWTDPIDSGAHFDDNLARRGSALASLPIELSPPPIGSEFQVPATFVRTEPYAGRRGMTAIFNARTGQWLEMNQPSEAEIQCLMPQELLPCRVNQATVTIKLNAPSRTLVVKSLVDGEFQEVYRKQNPSGVIRFELRGSEQLTLNEQGGLVLSLAISESDDERAQTQQSNTNVATASDPSRSTWKIDYVYVDFEATMQ